MTLSRLRPLAGLLLLLFAVLAPVIAAAQGGVGQAPGVGADQRRAINELGVRVDELERQIGAAAEDDARLVAIRLDLEGVARDLLNSAVAFRPRLQEINDRLQQIGPRPAEGQPPEPDIVEAERESLAAEKAEINAVLGVAEALSIRTSKLIERIATLRSDLFRNFLTKRYSLTDAFGEKLITDGNAELSALYRAFASWARFVFQFKFQAMLAATLMAVVAAAVLLVGGRRLLHRLIHADPHEVDPPYISRLSVAFWTTLLPTMTFAVFLTCSYLFFDYYNVLRGDIRVFIWAILLVLGLVFCVNRLARATLSPHLPNWRLVPVESGAARWLVRLATLMAVVIGLNYFLGVVNEQMSSPLTLTIARSFAATVVVGLLLILAGLLRPFRDEEGRRLPWPAWLRYTVFAIGGIMIATALLGYIGLAVFIALQVVLTGTLLLTAYVGFLTARAIGAEGGFAETSLGRWMAQHWRMEGQTLDQFGLVVSVAINLMIVLIFLPLVLLTWGFQIGDIQGWSYKIATGFTIGSFAFSPLGILTGIFVFLVGYFLTRWFQGWLDESVMARGKVDAGLRNSIRTVVGYAGLAVAALIAVSAAGLDLSNFALIAGGLSLGIGFGLQNVVSNFVSGLILLAERPFKAGDWITAGAVSGTVRKISVRATEIETFQRQTVILPNSELINSAVGNWTHRNRLGRIDIKVSVAYGCDVRRAHAVLLEIAREHPLVLKNPEPFVLFANFGPAGLEFEIRVHLSDILAGSRVQNDIRFAIMDAFAAEGIEIPSTPRAEVKPVAQPWHLDDERAEAEFIGERQKAEAEAEELKRSKAKRRQADPD